MQDNNFAELSELDIASVSGGEGHPPYPQPAPRPGPQQPDPFPTETQVPSIPPFPKEEIELPPAPRF